MKSTTSVSPSTATKELPVVPFANLPLQYANLEQQIQTELAPIWKNAEFILGKAAHEFERMFAQYCEVKECATLHTGTAALHLALLALDIGPGDEVITVTNSFIATAEAISYAGATPKFVDADPVTYNMDPSKVEAAITSKTKAIIPVHLYGQPAAMDEIVAIARKHKLYVIEDACQAHGARYKGKRAGSLADIGCFSFYPGKNLGAAGEGGAVVSNNPEWIEKVRLLRDHGSSKKYEHKIIGHNFRLDTLQSAVLKVKLPYLDQWNAMRREHASYYNEKLSAVPGIVVPVVAKDTEAVAHLYVIQVPDREKAQEALKADNCQFGIHYPTPIHLQEAYKGLGYKVGDFPVSEKLAGKILSLPMFPELTVEQQDRVIAALTRAFS